jgi:hypothetical protein
MFKACQNTVTGSWLQSYTNISDAVTRRPEQERAESQTFHNGRKKTHPTTHYNKRSEATAHIIIEDCCLPRYDAI